MPSIKSIFISFYLTFLAGAAGAALVNIAGPHFSLGWVGVAFTALPFLLFLIWVTLRQRSARTSARLPSITAFATAGVGLALWSWRMSPSEALPAALAVIGMANFFLYLLWYSELGPRYASALTIGRALPVFSVIDSQGHQVRSDAWRGRPAVLIFFRGNWCPLCMAQVRETAAAYRDIEALGACVALISPQPQTHTRALARRFDVGFAFYTDEANAAAKLLGIEQRGGLPFGMQALGYASDTVLPTVVIVDAQGIVRWAHQTDNYRIRPEPRLFLEALRAMGST